MDACGLQDTMREKVGLDDEVIENGSNLGVGQRQLLCLGRALLKDSKVLVLDEATSNVSNEVDEKIQETLREQMSHCTILTVAHRLHKVMRSDRIIFMDNGRIGEVGKPSELLSGPSMLRSLFDETGPSMAAYLRELSSGSRDSGAVSSQCEISQYQATSPMKMGIPIDILEKKLRSSGIEDSSIKEMMF